jgi:uncharacterized heparinase superfamily protein
VSRPGLPTLLRTLWYMRRSQVTGELRDWLLGPRRVVSRQAEEMPHLRVAAVKVTRPRPPKHLQQGRARGWADPSLGPVELDALHRFDWLAAESLRPADRLGVMLDWIANHPSGHGWQPASISRRSLAWLACLTTPRALPPPSDTHGRVLPSLADQLATLEQQLRSHRSDGALLFGLLALASAGVLLEGGEAERWLLRLPQLVRELALQIGPDGAHIERSPMLHGELLVGLLDLLNALRATPGVAPAELERALERSVAAMLAAHAVWTHPDGEIALLGDSTLGVALPVDELAAYAKALGVEALEPKQRGVLPAAGVVRLEAGPFVVIFSAAAPAPAWHPAHAHCDALSFELSAFGERVVCDTGTGGAAEAAGLARSTRAHATVLVNGAEQAELWGDDRIGGRPDVGLVRVTPDVCVEGVCAGWSTPDVLHRRLLAIDAEGVRIEDRFDQPARHARLALPLAPGVSVRLDGAHAQLGLPRGRQLALALPEVARWRVERAPCFLAPSVAAPRSVLVGEAHDLAAADWRIEWSSRGRGERGANR